MTTQLLASELTNLIQESKRKHNDLRLAAEKSLEELKTIKASNEAQAAAELAQRPNFVNPFIIACGTKNVKFTGIAIVCLQRLIVARALPRTKLDQALEALREATSAGLDVQLKILQALPSLLQNYASDLRGDLLITTLNICFVLQTSKNAIVNNTSAATLQQLVVSVFDKVVAEDKAGNAPTAGEAPTADGAVELRAAALDAYRVFNDLCLMTESQRPEYLRFSGLPQTFGLELIESVLTNHASIFLNHPEQTHILRVRVMPFIISALHGRPNFATTVRLVRILYTLLRRHLHVLPSEAGDALDILTHLLDQDTALWKRALCMEVFRGVFSEHALVRRIFAIYDAQEGEKPILKNLTATFVRLSTEKPSVIGLGHQSSIPVSNPYGNAGASADHVMLEASGVTGIITTGASEGSNTGISLQWSNMRVPCIDQLDKTEPPSIPESYIYSLALSCISSFSEGLAKFILPLTVPADSRNRKRNPKLEGNGRDSPAPSVEGSPHPLGPRGQLERAGSFKKNPVPRNPLSLEDHPLYSEVKICAAIVDECWPAFLATCSTFLYAALDSEYYHGLVRAFQRFAHVAGLLQLTTPRDAFLTTLGKVAVPPNVITACLNAGTSRTQNTETPVSSNSILSNAKGLLSVDSLVTTGSSVTDRGRQPSFDASAATLTTRNLLCLRALLNLGIALGPTLHSSWRIILETLQQADFVLFTTNKTPGRTPTVSRSSDQMAENEANTLLSNFSSETRAVETAASRLIESTVDFPNDAFVQVVEAICDLLGRKRDSKAEKHGESNQPQSPPIAGNLKAPENQHHRSASVSSSATGPNQENQFALAKLGDLATINIERLLSYDPDDSGWTVLTTELIRTLNSQSANASVRLRAADILVKLALESANVASTLEEEERGSVQLQVLESLRDALVPLQEEDREVSVATHSTDVDIHKAVLDGLKNLLENCGETLIDGWEVAFEIIGSIFMRKQLPSEGQKEGDVQATALVTRSARLVRSSFNSLQLICSDFLASLPNSCFLILVDTLYKFCSQDDDLNIALTTVTFFWVLSDFLSGQNKAMSITADLMQGAGVSDLVAKASQSGAGANAALWMLLLLRLTTVTNDDRLELRNSAIQTLLRIFDAYGDNLNPEAWHTCVKHVVFRLLSSIEEELQSVDDESGNEDRREWHDTSVIVLNGISELLAAYLDVLAKHPSFNQLWQELLQHFTTLLNFKALEINTAMFKALGNIVSPEHHANRSIFSEETVESAWRLWSSGIPVPQDASDTTDNQNCLIAYVGAFDDIYKLIRADLTVEKVKQILTLFREALQTATVGAYVNDAEYATPLQTRVLDAIKKIRTDLDGVPAVMIAQVAEFVRLPFPEKPAQSDAPPSKRTFVALSKGSMTILQELILAHASDTDVYSSSALAAALASLARPIKLKYSFPVVTKVQPWQLATNTALAILDATLPHLHGPDVPRATIQRVWELIVEIADGIINAESQIAPAAADVTNDQSFDINAFRRLRDLIIPALGSEVIPDLTRKAYAESLFRTSMIHSPSPGEMALIYGNGGGSDGAGLSALYKTRVGRTIDPEPTARYKMSYVCLDELFSLVAAYDEPSGPTIVVQPPTPRFPPPGHFSGQHSSENPQALHIRTARTAAPFLIFRAALPLRSFIADQPLRGLMPQPLSQRRELLRVLQNLVDLKSQPEAIPDTPNVDCEGRKHLLRLYPLLVGTVRVAGATSDEAVLKIASEALEVVGGTGRLSVHFRLPTLAGQGARGH